MDLMLPGESRQRDRCTVSLVLQTYAVKEALESRVGTNTVPLRVDVEVNEFGLVLFVCRFQRLLLKTKTWRRGRDSNPPLNVSSTTSKATDGTFRQFRLCKTVVMAGKRQVVEVTILWLGTAKVCRLIRNFFEKIAMSQGIGCG